MQERGNFMVFSYCIHVEQTDTVQKPPNAFSDHCMGFFVGFALFLKITWQFRPTFCANTFFMSAEVYLAYLSLRATSNLKKGFFFVAPVVLPVNRMAQSCVTESLGGEQYKCQDFFGLV